MLLLFLPEWWQRIGLEQTDQPTLQTRLLLGVTILFLGAASSLALVSRAYHRQAKNHAAELKALQQRFEDAAANEKKRSDDFNRPLNIDTKYVV